MAYLYIVQPGHTDWSLQKRVESAVGVPLCEAGASTMSQLAEEFAGRSIDMVFAGPNEAARQSGKMLAEALGVRCSVEDDLRELDFGLWQGLTLEEVKKRHGRVYKQWIQAPVTVCPPGGEMVEDALVRVRAVFRRIGRKHAAGRVLVVACPIAAGLARCHLAGVDPEQLWRYVYEPGCWDGYELPAGKEQKQS